MSEVKWSECMDRINYFRVCTLESYLSQIRYHIRDYMGVPPAPRASRSFVGSFAGENENENENDRVFF